MTITSVMLPQVADLVPGYPFDASMFNDAGAGVPVIRIRDVIRGHSETFYSGEYSPEYLVNAGDFLVGMDGEFNLAVWKDGPALLNQRVCKIVPKVSAIEPSYLLQLLPKELKNIEDRTPFVTVKHLSMRELREIKLSLPSLVEQRRVVRILDKANAIREKRSKAHKLNEEFLRSVFLEMFGDPLRAGDRNEVVGNLSTIVRGSSPRPQGDPRYFGGPIPRLMVADLTRDGWWVTPRIDSLTIEGARRSRPIVAGTLVMAVSGNVGVVARLRVDACIHDGFIALTELDVTRVDPNYLLYCLHLLKSSHDKRKAGAIFQNLTTNDIKSMPVPLPPLEQQASFGQLFEKCLAMSTSSKNFLLEADALFDSLAHRELAVHL